MAAIKKNKQTKRRAYRKKTKYSFGSIIFDSKPEFERFLELKSKEAKKEITMLERASSYDLIVNGCKICRYTPDFEYKENGKQIIEEVKSKQIKKMRPDYSIRVKLFKALHPDIVFREILV